MMILTKINKDLRIHRQQHYLLFFKSVDKRNNGTN